MNQPITTYEDFLTRLLLAMLHTPHRNYHNYRARIYIGNDTHCPLTALCYAETGHTHLPFDALSAAEELHIDLDLACKIVDATDNPKHPRHKYLKQILSIGASI